MCFQGASIHSSFPRKWESSFYEPIDFIHSEVDPRLRGDDAFWMDRNARQFLQFFVVL